MADKKITTEKVWAKKDGYESREFTMQQLKAMGTDKPDGNTYDGWQVTTKAETPKELTGKKRATKTDASDGAISKTKEAAQPDSEDSGIIGDDSSQGSQGDTKAS